MNTILYLLPLCALVYYPVTPAQPEQATAETATERNFFRFGDQLITIVKQGNPASKNYVLLSLHSDEHKAIGSLIKFSRRNGSHMVRLLNSNRRMIEGNFLDEKIAFDPNHIYTDWGRKEHLKKHNTWTRYLDMKVEQFSQFLLNELPHGKTIVTLHTHPAHTIRDFIEKRKLRRQVKEWHRNPAMHVSDYFITTDENIFNRIKEQDFNIVLLHPKRIHNNGGLPVHCAREKLSYVEIESLEDHAQARMEMLMAVDVALN